MQQELSAIKVSGQVLTELPVDLYIPPHAMRVFLEVFEGPFDLLLYLIRKNNIDILDIPVASITKQYINYIDLMKEFKLELAADYLEMAALLMEIKSRMLLPVRQAEHTAEILDPRAELVRKLQEYEQIKAVAIKLDNLARLERDIFLPIVECNFEVKKLQPELDLRELLRAFRCVLDRADLYASHSIAKEPLSVRERMSRILSELEQDRFTPFFNFFHYDEGRAGVVVTFLAILELAKEMLIDFVQTEPFAPIYVRLI